MVFPWTLGAMAQNSFPAAERVAWPLAQHVPDAVLIELGENDCHAWDCTDPARQQELEAAYVAFVKSLAAAYAKPAMPFFFVIAMHEAGQSGPMKSAAATLTGAGYSATFVNATAPSTFPDTGAPVPTGCGGHPSYAANGLAMERARAVIAAALGW